MRRSPLRNNLARLRLFLNLGQKEIADLAGCSTHTIQSVELGRLALSEDLARRVSAATGVHLRWLLDNDLKAPIVRAGFGHTWPYTLSDFERRQATRAQGDNELSRQMMADYAASFYGQIRALLSGAVKRDLAEVAVWRVGKFLEECRSEFGFDKEMIRTEEQFGLRADDSPYLKFRQINAGISLFRKYDRDRERSIARTLAQLRKARQKRSAPSRHRKNRK
jgi:transcriptional regulator with XRE-family HTH domain